MADNARVTKDITTGIGTISFPRVFESTKGKKKDGSDVYDIQIIIPKTQRDDLKAIFAAIKAVGMAKYGENWKKVGNPLRDGDAEKDELTEDGSTTRGEKYPERLGCYFINARSTKPVGVYDRSLTPITNPGDLYGGCKAKISVTFYPYSVEGNHGVGCSLNGVQKVADGEAFGNTRPSVESMFEALDDPEDDGLGDDLDADGFDEPEEEPTPPPAKKRAPAKKAAAKKAAPVEVDDADDLSDLDSQDDLDDLDDLDSDL